MWLAVGRVENPKKNVTVASFCACRTGPDLYDVIIIRVP